jgi:hypothetical protein
MAQRLPLHALLRRHSERADPVIPSVARDPIRGRSPIQRRFDAGSLLAALVRDDRERARSVACLRHPDRADPVIPSECEGSCPGTFSDSAAFRRRVPPRFVRSGRQSACPFGCLLMSSRPHRKAARGVPPKRSTRLATLRRSPAYVIPSECEGSCEIGSSERGPSSQAPRDDKESPIAFPSVGARLVPG